MFSHLRVFVLLKQEVEKYCINPVLLVYGSGGYVFRYACLELLKNLI